MDEFKFWQKLNSAHRIQFSPFWPRAQGVRREAVWWGHEGSLAMVSSNWRLVHTHTPRCGMRMYVPSSGPPKTEDGHTRDQNKRNVVWAIPYAYAPPPPRHLVQRAAIFHRLTSRCCWTQFSGQKTLFDQGAVVGQHRANLCRPQKKIQHVAPRFVLGIMRFHGMRNWCSLGVFAGK